MKLIYTILTRVLLVGAALHASGVQAACSLQLGQVVINEVRSGTGSGEPAFVELKILDPSVIAATGNFSGWKLAAYNANNGNKGEADVGSAFADIAMNTCGQNSAWFRIPDSSLGSKVNGASSLNLVLFDSAGGGKIADIMRLGSTSNGSYYDSGSTYTACATVESALPATIGGNTKYDALKGSGSSVKDYFRDPDGTGNWGGQDTAGGAQTKCGSNDGGGAFGLTKVASAALVPINTNFTFTLYAKNGATGTGQTGVQISDNLNTAGLTFVSCTTTSGTCTNAGGVVTWSVGTVAVDSTKTATLTVYASAAGTKINTITSNVGTPVASASAAVQAYAPLGDWHMDESSWTGVANEVKDSSGNNNHGRARIANGSTPVATTASGSPAYTSGSQNTCNYGDFDRASGPVRTHSYVELSGLPTLPASFTFAAWIKSTNASASGQRILVRDDAQNGWGFSLGDPGQAKIRFFNRNITNSGTVTGDGSNPGCGVFCLDTAAVITNNAWFFVAVAVDTTAKTVTHYVYNAAGTLVSNTSSPYSGTWKDGTGTAAIGGETSASSEGTQSSFHFLGNIDEFQIYSGVLAQADLAILRTRTRACTASGPDHVELVHDGAALNCTPKAVTVLACTTSASCNGVLADQYSSGAFTFTPTAISGAQWCTDSLCASPISGAVTLSNNATIYLREPTARTDTMAGTASGTTNASVQCTNTSTSAFNSTTACNVAFASSGFLMNAANHYACTAQTITLQAVKSSATGTTCIPAFASVNRSVSLYSTYANPTTGTKTASLDYITSSGAATSSLAALATTAGSPSTLGSLYFDSTGTATLTNFLYPDVGQVTLHPTYTGSAATGDAGLSLTAVSGNSFIAAPKSFVFSAIPAAPLTAGNPFNTTVTAYNNCSTPAATPNFGKETTAATVALSSTNPLPALGNATAISSTLSGFTAGAASTNLTWNEVGTFDLVATTSSYLGSALSPTSTQLKVGRFIPAYFDTVVAQGCGAFTYAGWGGQVGPPVLPAQPGQPFTATVTARATGGTVTKNYAGATWAKPVTLSQSTAVAGTLTSASIAATTFVDGVGTASPTFNFTASPSIPSSAAIHALDTDGVASIAASVGPPVIAGTEGTVPLRSGRVRVLNAYGSELLALPVPTVFEYYASAASGWVTGTDTCTVLGAGNFAFSFPVNATNNLAACETAVAVAGVNPRPTVTLSAPGAGNSGWADLTLNLGAVAGNQCTAVGGAGGAATTANAPWLQFNWLGAGVANPTSRVTFGVYKSPLIYRRENY